jgi:hypothetical protein
MARYAPLTLDTAAGLPAPRSTVSRSPAQSAAPKPGLLQRMFDALIRARTIQAEREIARYLATSQGKWTDQMEREIERRLVDRPNRINAGN